RDRREIEVAGDVIARAVLRNADLRPAGERAALRARLLAFDMLRADPSGSVRLNAVADKLRGAARSAGTRAPESPEDQVDRADRAVQRGAGVHELGAMQRFEREYDQLTRTGMRASRDTYIATQLQRWRAGQRR